VNRVIVAAIILVMASSAIAEPIKGQVSVIGVAEAILSPDNVTWRLLIEEKDQDLAKAKKLSDERLARLLSAAVKLNLGNEDLEIGKITVEKVAKRDGNGNDKGLLYYAVKSTVVVHLADLGRFDEYVNNFIVDQDVEATMQFGVRNIEATTDSLRLDAVHNARVKAAEFARVAGATIGAPLLISEYKPTAPIREVEEDQALARQMSWGGSRFTTPEKIRVYIRVWATFELLSE
jgi:uncharacterized protein